MAGQIGHFRFPDPDAEDDQHAQSSSELNTNSQHDSSDSETHDSTPPAAGSHARGPIATAMLAAFGISTLLLLVLSFTPWYADDEPGQTVPAACRNLSGRDYAHCVGETMHAHGQGVHLHWNAWGSWLTRPVLFLLLVVAIFVASKVVFVRERKVSLPKWARLALLFGDALTIAAFFHAPYDQSAPAWGLWLSLVCVLALNVGVLLATTEAGEWVADRWPRRAKPKKLTPAPQSTSGPPQPMTGPPPNQRTDYRPTPQAAPPSQRQSQGPGWPTPDRYGQRSFPDDDRPSPS